MTLHLSAADLRLLRAVSTALLSPTDYASERAWHLAIMQPLRRLTGADKGGIRSVGAAGPHWTECNFDPAAIPEYNRYFARFDHGRALGGREVPSYVISSIRRFRDRLPELHRSEFYRDFLAPYGFFDGITLSSRKREQHKGSTLYLWHERELTASARSRTIAILDLLLPTFRSGMGSPTPLGGSATPFYAAVDALSEGCALFTESGLLLHQNPALTRLHAECAHPESVAAATMEVMRAVRETCLDTRAASGPLRSASHEVTDADGAYRIRGTLLDRSAVGTFAAILVTIARDRGTERVLRSDELRARFRLTAREADVALLLAARRTNEEIAARLGMSAHTARHHTESVLRKLGAASRTEVAAVLAIASRAW